MPPRKRTSTTSPGKPVAKRPRTVQPKSSTPSKKLEDVASAPGGAHSSRGVRTRQQLLDNPDSESGTSDSEPEETYQRDSGSKEDSSNTLSSVPPEHVAICAAQARAEVKAFLRTPHPGDAKAQHSLNDLLSALLRGESNSAMLLGPHGTGKTSAIDAAIDRVGGEDALHLVRLHSTLHPNDKVAVRELVRQLVAMGALAELYAQDLADFDDEVEPMAEDVEDEVQEESSDDEASLGSDDEEAAVQSKLRRKRREAAAKQAAEDTILASVSTATAHLLSLLAQSPEAAKQSKGSVKCKERITKPIVIVLDNMDEFALRPKQALLYVLLDAVQASSYPPGLLVLATSTRGDALDLLEKRVKSRFSHRMIHMRPPSDLEAYTSIVRQALELDPECVFCHLSASTGTTPRRSHSSLQKNTPPSWSAFVKAWNKRVDHVVDNTHVQALLAHQMETSWDMRTLGQAMVRAMAMLPPDPLPSIGLLARALALGEVRAQDALLRSLSVPESTVLAAALRVSHARGQETFTLTMLQAELTSLLPPRRDHRRKVSKTGLANPAILLAAFQSLHSLAILIPAVVTHNLADPPELSLGWIPSVVAGGARGGRAGPAPIWFLPTRLAVMPRDVIATLSDPSRPVPVDQKLIKWAQHKAE